MLPIIPIHIFLKPYLHANLISKINKTLIKLHNIHIFEIARESTVRNTTNLDDSLFKIFDIVDEDFTSGKSTPVIYFEMLPIVKYKALIDLELTGTGNRATSPHHRAKDKHCTIVFLITINPGIYCHHIT